MDELKIVKGKTKNTTDNNGNKTIDTRVFVYYNDKKIGKALIRDYGDNSPFLSDLGIDKEQRGKGLGQKMLKMLMEEYKINELTVLKNNHRAIHIYKKFGFKTVKEFNDFDGAKTLYMKKNKIIKESCFNY